MSKVGIAVCSAVLLAGPLIVVVAAPTAGSAQAAVAAPGGTYRPVTASRILDTRIGLGAAAGATQSVTVRAAGAAGIPMSGVSAIAVNLTVTAPASTGYLTAYATGGARPTASIANYVRGHTLAALAVVPVNPDVQFTVYSASRAQLIADVAGYFTTAQAATTSGRFKALSPARLMDTRIAFGGTAPRAHGITSLKVTGAGGVPATGVSAVVINTTVTAPTASGYVTAYPAGIATPRASTINFSQGETRANRAIVPVGQDGKISFYNAAGTTQLVIDVNGYISDDAGSGGSYYVSGTPYRLADTRTYGEYSWYDANNTNTVGITVDGPYTSHGSGRAPSLTSVAKPTAAWLTVTAINPTAHGPLTAYPSNVARPTTSDVNANPATIVANSGPVGIGPDGGVKLFSAPGYRASGAGVLLDIAGYFVDSPANPTPSGLWAWGIPSVGPAFQQNALKGVRAVAGTSGETYALLADGSVAGWVGPRLTGSELSRPTPQHDGVSAIHDITQLAGTGTVYALRSDGTVWAWGADAYGEFGNGSRQDGAYIGYDLNPPHYMYPQTVQTTGLDHVTLVGAATHVGYAVEDDGTVWAWGTGGAGQLGNGSTSGSYVPVQVTGLTGVTSIAGGDRITYALDSDGQLWRWGNVGSSAGATTYTTPQEITGACAVGASVVANRAGGWELCADGSVWQLDYAGQTSSAGTNYFHKIPDLSDVSAISSATDRESNGVGRGVQALRDDGTVWRFNSSTATFEAVYGLTGIRAIGGSSDSAYAIV